MIRIVCLICFFYLVSAKAQSGSLYNIKLKSGLVLKCELIKMVPDSFVVIKQYDQVSTIPYSDIESIQFAGSIPKSEPQVVAPPEPPRYMLRNLPEPRWTFGYQMGPNLSVDADFWEDFGSSFRFSALKGVNKSCELGFNIGTDVYLDYESLFLVAQLQGRAYFRNDKPRSGFVYAQAGYGFMVDGLEDLTMGGINGAFGFGAASRTRRNGVFSFMVGPRLQTFRETWNTTFFDGNSFQSQQRVFNNYLIGIETKLEWRF